MINLEKIKKFIIESEYSRLIALFLLTLYCYSAFLTNTNLGRGDAFWYQYIIHDAIIQLQHGLFPTYVGQSIFSAFGGPIIRAPYYLLFGQLLHVVTLGQFNSLTIQHLTIVVSALAAAFICYFLFVKLAPKQRWSAVAFSLFYISCPGVIGLIYICDMYYSFMALPYIPIVIYGLLQAQQKNNALFYVITAAALSLILMAHPPIAVWVVGICALFYGLQLMFLRKGLLGVLLFLCVFTLLSLWQFVSIFKLGLNSSYAAEHKNYVDEVIAILRADIPGVFLPLGLWKGEVVNPFLQLGYSLWFAILGAIIVAFRYAKTNFSLRCLLVCIALFMLLLYPLPFLTHFLWSLVPKIVTNITYIWPMQRFYILLAALSCFVAVLALKIFKDSHSKKNQILTTVLFLLCFWNIYQSYYFLHIGYGMRNKSQSWSKPENIHLYLNYLRHTETELFKGVYEPRLKNRLLNQQQIPIANYDNEIAVVNECTSTNTVPIKANQTSPMPLLLLRTKVTANQYYLLCLQTAMKDVYGEFAVSAPNYNSFLETSKPTGLAKNNKPIVAIPFFTTDPDIREISFELRKVQGDGTLKINSSSFVNYDPNKLPIHVESFTPYIAQVTTPTDHTYLEVFKEFYQGYQAKVNDQIVSVLPSKDKMILIPLDKAGLNKIELVYVGTESIRISFYISAITWGMIIIYLSLFTYRRYTRKK